jgi:hypothetical protein
MDPDIDEQIAHTGVVLVPMDNCRMLREETSDLSRSDVLAVEPDDVVRNFCLTPTARYTVVLDLHPLKD